MKNLYDLVLDRIAAGHGYDKMYQVPPTQLQQRNMAEEELNGMSHTEFLERLSSALDDMFPAEDS